MNMIDTTLRQFVAITKKLFIDNVYFPDPIVASINTSFIWSSVLNPKILNLTSYDKQKLKKNNSC